MGSKKISGDFSSFNTVGAVLTLVGTIIGAGILGIPYVFAKAGFFTGIIVIIFTSIFFVYMYLCLGEAILRTKGEHQLPGLAGKYLGKKGKKVMFIAMLLSSYGSLIAYLIASGQAIHNLLSGIFNLPSFMNNPLFFSIAFFAFTSILILKGLNVIRDSEVVVTGFLVLIVVVIFFITFPNMQLSNLSKFRWDGLFIPYGAIFFAFMGFTTVPEAVRIMDKKKSLLPLVLILSVIIPLIIYVLFSTSIVGVMGSNTSELATIGLEDIFGIAMLFIGNFFLLFSVTTSFLAIGFAQQNVFTLDYVMPKFIAWFIACCVPFFLFLTLTNVMGFVEVLSASGVLFGGTMALLILLLSYNAKKKGTRKPEYVVPMNVPLLILSIVILIFGVVTLFA